MRLIYHKYAFWFCLIAIISSACLNKEVNTVDNRPNIVLIVADDLGYSDLGCFGSEISTPNLDQLASQGNIFSSFYTSATCSPTRAMLLTGTDNHLAGLGNMAENIPFRDEQLGQPGYEGFLNDRVVTFASLLQDSGYNTYASGKWHLGLEKNQSPESHGFDRSFMLMNAYSGHYYSDPNYDLFWDDDDYGKYPDGKYSTEIYTDKLLGFLKKNKKKNRPFFLYAAYTSPHWPLQAPQEYIEKYKGKYDSGYEALRKQRFNGLRSKGILSDNTSLPKLPKFKGELYSISTDTLENWDSLDNYEKRIQSRKMEIYAGMVENLDFHIGRLIHHLKEIGEYDNTMIVFMSDNGAAVLELNDVPEGVEPLDYMGTPNSFVAYGPQWAHASSAINYLYKGYIAEGGIRSPMIIKMPYQLEGNGIHSLFTSVMDLAPSFLELAGINYPVEYQGNKISPLQGESIIPYLTNKSSTIHHEDYVMGWELFGRYAIRKGNWKITWIEPPFGKGEFQLFNLKDDPGETSNLSEEYPDKFDEMVDHWEEYVYQNGVIPLQ